MFAGPGGLDGGVEGQQVRLRGDVVDHLDDGPDLHRPFAEALDLLGRRLDRAADPVHPADRLGHGGFTLEGRIGGRGGGLRGGLGALGHLRHGLAHRVDGAGRLADVDRLLPPRSVGCRRRRTGP